MRLVFLLQHKHKTKHEMEKETLLTGFNERLGNPDAQGMYAEAGVSSRTLDAYIDGVLPTISDDSEVNDAFWERHINFIKAVGGQMRHEKAEFAKNYKPDVPPVTDPPAKTDPAPPAPGDKGELQKLLERMEEMENERKEEKKQIVAKGLRMEAKAKADAMNVSNKALWNDAVDQTECKDGMDAEAVTQAAKALYERKLKEYFGEGATPYGSNAGGGGKSGKELDAFFDRKRAEGKFPKKG